MTPLKLGMAAILALSLSACGNTFGDRTLSGAAIGTAGGAALGAATGGLSVLGGALIGGAVGAAAGAVTKEDQVNLGRPIWR
jgi:hypothetical protein